MFLGLASPAVKPLSNVRNIDFATGVVLPDVSEPEEEPEPTPVNRGALAFPVEALLSPILIRWVTEAATALDSPPDFPAWGALAACSTRSGSARCWP